VSSFVEPCIPTQGLYPPKGPNWVHEVKFDGFRCQLHKHGDDVVLFSRNGKDFTKHYLIVRAAAGAIPVRSMILDGEFTAYADDGREDFKALLERRTPHHLCLWVFDLLALHGRSQRINPLWKRRMTLDSVMDKIHSPNIRYSEQFQDPDALLAECARRGLEGIVSKRTDKGYRSGKSTDWIKVKAKGWREHNAWRGEFFQTGR
jgi:bifunctional non-homologous end joining protein LigD